MRGWSPRRMAWFCLGCLAVAVGALGVILPLLPTTPFAILAAFAFGRSAPALQRRIEESRLFGPVIADWRANGAIAPRYKAMSIVAMAAILVVSFALSVPWILILVQVVFMGAAAAFILSRPGGAPPQR